MKITLAERLEFTKNRPAGFDWLRILLACSIVAWHSIVTSYGAEAQDVAWTNPVLRPFIVSMLGMFFALSGFLVAGSLGRCRTMVSFAGLRIMRIFPALVVETLLSAFVLGPLLTYFRITDYFSSPELTDYFHNMIGVVRFTLPGLFTTNPLPNIVNGQLWTVPFELRCYEVLIAVSMFGIYARKWTFAAATVVLMVALAATRAFVTHRYDAVALTGSQLVLCFLYGVLLFRLRSSIPWSRWIAVPAAIFVVVLSSFSGGADFIALPMSYLTVYLGLLNPPRVSLLFSGDYSYGLFLYGFPVQQAVASAGGWAHHWYINLILAFPLTALIAVGSWWLIEKPVLSRKKDLIWLEDRAIVAARSLREKWVRRTL